MLRLCTECVALLVLTALMASAPATLGGQEKPARGKATEKAEKAVKADKEAKAKLVPFQGKVSAVDKIEKCIKLAGKEKDRVFYLTSKTKMIKAGKPATLDDVVVGELVGGQAQMSVDGKAEIMSLRIGPKPEGKAEPQGGPTPKKEKVEKEKEGKKSGKGKEK